MRKITFSFKIKEPEIMSEIHLRFALYSSHLRYEHVAMGYLLGARIIRHLRCH